GGDSVDAGRRGGRGGNGVRDHAQHRRVSCLAANYPDEEGSLRRAGPSMETEARVDALIDRWEEMQEHGTPLTIEALCSDCPELVVEVRRRLGSLKEKDAALRPDADDAQPAPGE